MLVVYANGLPTGMWCDIRQVVGDRDAMLAGNRNLDAHLTRFGIRHDFVVLTGVGHNALAVFEAIGNVNWAFYRTALHPDAADTGHLHMAAVAATVGRGDAFHAQGSPRPSAFAPALRRDRPVAAAATSHDCSSPAARDHHEAPFDGGVMPLEPGRRVLFAFGKAASSDRQVTRKRILDELEALRRDLGSNDTVVIYSHTHGVKSRGSRPGGLPLDEPDPAKGRPMLLDWREYADRLLHLPARTVVVLTMACHSGGLVTFLNENEDARRQWQSRRDQGRDLLVLTSQNDHSLSNPRRIDGRLINPFTHAVIEAFGGKADGFGSTMHDGRISLGELAGYVLEEARRHTAPGDKANDPDPQMTGALSPDAILGGLKSGG